MNEEEVFGKLRAASWTDEDLAMLKHAIKYDRRLHFEAVIDMLGHIAEKHDNQQAAKALRAMCEFSLFIYQGIQRARFTCNNSDERINGLVAFYMDRSRRAAEIETNLDAKFSLLNSVQGRTMDSKGAVH